MYTLILLGYLTASVIFALMMYSDDAEHNNFGKKINRGPFRDYLKAGLLIIPGFLLFIGFAFLIIKFIGWILVHLFEFLYWTSQNMP